MFVVIVPISLTTFEPLVVGYAVHLRLVFTSNVYCPMNPTIINHPELDVAFERPALLCIEPEIEGKWSRLHSICTCFMYILAHRRYIVSDVDDRYSPGQLEMGQLTIFISVWLKKSGGREEEEGFPRRFSSPCKSGLPNFDETLLSDRLGEPQVP